MHCYLSRFAYCRDSMQPQLPDTLADSQDFSEASQRSDSFYLAETQPFVESEATIAPPGRPFDRVPADEVDTIDLTCTFIDIHSQSL